MERIRDKDEFIFVSAADQRIAWEEEATKSLEGKKATIWKCISGGFERTVAERVNRTPLSFYSTKPFDHRRQ